MKRFSIATAFLTATLLFCFGFILNGDNDPHASKYKPVNQHESITPVHHFDPNSVVYTDNFDGANDTISLKARGYLVWYRGTGPQGLTATWFQGDPTVFSSYNGPANGYVAANYNVVTGTNNIDSWLVFPRMSGGLNAGDSLYFYERSLLNDPYPDSLRVMYSVSDSIPEGSWTELGRFLSDISGNWTLFSFRAPTTSVNGRFAIRYCVADGGPSGNNSDYIGIDAATIVSNLVGVHTISSQVPSSYNLAQNYPNPFNPSTIIKFAIPKAGNVVIKMYDILGREVKTLVNSSLQPGTYSYTVDASDLASGVYLYRITTAGFTKTMKMSLIK